MTTDYTKLREAATDYASIAALFADDNCTLDLQQAVYFAHHITKPILDERDKLIAEKAQLLDALAQALPFVEDAEESPHFKKGFVRNRVVAIRALIERADKKAGVQP